MRYYASISIRGTVKYGQLPGSIGVHDSPGDSMPCGIASGKGPDEQGRAVWRLAVRGQPIEGEWIIVDGEFVPAQ